MHCIFMYRGSLISRSGVKGLSGCVGFCPVSYHSGRVCACVLVAAALTRQEVVPQDGLFDQVVRHQLCAVHQRVSRDVGQSPCAEEGA